MRTLLPNSLSNFPPNSPPNSPPLEGPGVVFGGARGGFWRSQGWFSCARAKLTTPSGYAGHPSSERKFWTETLDNGYTSQVPFPNTHLSAKDWRSRTLALRPAEGRWDSHKAFQRIPRQNLNRRLPPPPFRGKPIPFRYLPSTFSDTFLLSLLLPLLLVTVRNLRSSQPPAQNPSRCAALLNLYRPSQNSEMSYQNPPPTRQLSYR